MRERAPGGDAPPPPGRAAPARAPGGEIRTEKYEQQHKMPIEPGSDKMISRKI